MLFRGSWEYSPIGRGDRLKIGSVFVRIELLLRSCSSVGRASALHALGHRFEPYRDYARLAKLADAIGLGPILLRGLGSSPRAGTRDIPHGLGNFQMRVETESGTIYLIDMGNHQVTRIARGFPPVQTSYLKFGSRDKSWELCPYRYSSTYTPNIAIPGQYLSIIPSGSFGGGYETTKIVRVTFSSR